MADETDILQILSVISAAFPNFQEQANTPEIYYQLLSDIDADLLKAAVLHCCGEPGRKFAPSIGEIRGAVSELQRIASGAPTSYQAWEEVRRAMLETGSYGQPQWSDPVVAAAVNTLGWRNLCLSEDTTADRARFIAAYEQLRARAETDRMMLPQVRGYIVANDGAQLSSSEGIKLLADKWRGKS